MSRSGKIRCPEKLDQFPNIEYHKGDCLDNDTFNDLIQDVDGVIHTVGTMTDHEKYKSMNQLGRLSYNAHLIQ
jgi:putative NADH-flavin reductase